MDGRLQDLIKARGVSLGWNPLHCVVEQENITLVKEFLNENDVNVCDNFGRTALSIAASKGNLKMIELLIEEGANVNQGYPLHYACEKGHCDTVLYLIQKGADVNLEKDASYPLLIASIQAHLEVVKILIEHGADIGATNENGETVLHLACETANIELITFLIDSGANINVRDKFQMNPLSVCLVRMEDNPELTKLLLEKGASIDLTDKNNDSVLHISSNPESLIELIKFGANVNAQNESNETPLYQFTFYHCLDCCRILLEHGADPNIAAFGGWTPLHIAAIEGDLDYVEQLLKWKADVNCTSALNIIPLHFAAKNGHFEIISKLVQHGSLIDVPIIDMPDVNSYLPHFVDRDCMPEGSTPLTLALLNKHYEIAKFLISHGAKYQEISLLPIPQEYIPLQISDKVDDWPNYEIIKMIRKNDLEKIVTISRDDDNLKIIDQIGWSLLHHSVSKSFYEMSHELIQKGVSVNAQDNFERTPLSIAASKNDVKLLKLLLDNGADVNLGLPIHYAADKESIDCIVELINNGCLIDIKTKRHNEVPVLVEAVSQNKTRVVKLLLESKSDPNCTNKWGETPLHCCAQNGNLELARLLLEYGAKVNAVDSFKDNPLICATTLKHTDIVELLLENQADVNAVDNSKWTALHRAASNHFVDGALILIQAGASVNSLNEEGESPLFLAAENHTILKALVQNNADVNFRTDDGWSPLHESAHAGVLDCVKELLDNKVNVNVASAENVLPIYLASIDGHVDVVKELLDHGSYIDPLILDLSIIRNESGAENHPLTERYHVVPGNTPLIGAAAKGHLEVVKLLHSRGASLEITNSNGNNALHEAVLNNFEEIVGFLVELNGAGLDVKNKAQMTALDLTKETGNEVIINLICNKL